MSDYEQEITFGVNSLSGNSRSPDLIVNVVKLKLLVRGEDDIRSVKIKLCADGNHDVPNFIHTDYQEDQNKLFFKEAEEMTIPEKATLLLTIPKNCYLRAISENRPTMLENINGDVDISSENGLISVKDTRGMIDIRSENGAVVVKNSEGIAEIKTDNGSIDVSHVSGSLNLATVNGLVRCYNFDCDKVGIATVNGSIYCEIPNVERGLFKLSSKNGAIRLNIPETLSYNLCAVNENGRLYFGLTDNYETEREGNRRLIKAVKGAGKVQISVTNENGAISVLGNNQKKQNFSNIDSDFEKLDRYKREKELKKIIRLQFNRKFAEEGGYMDKLNFGKLDLKNNPRDIIAGINEKIKKDVFAGFNTPLMNDKYYQGNRAEENTEQRNESEKVKSKSEDNPELKILKMVEAKIITIEEASKLIDALQKED